MHISNVVAAYVLTVHDQLRGGMRQAELEPRELAALTLVAEHDGCSQDWLRPRVELTQSGTVRLVDRLPPPSPLPPGGARPPGAPPPRRGGRAPGPPAGPALRGPGPPRGDGAIEAMLGALPPPVRAGL